jgi:hypothetical protein
MKLDVEMLLELAAATKPERREEFLERDCPDPAVRRERAALLQYADDAESFFDHAIQCVAASGNPTALGSRPHPQLPDRFAD